VCCSQPAVVLVKSTAGLVTAATPELPFATLGTDLLVSSGYSTGVRVPAVSTTSRSSQGCNFSNCS
jgi:hypothetical protein